MWAACSILHHHERPLRRSSCRLRLAIQAEYLRSRNSYHRNQKRRQPKRSERRREGPLPRQMELDAAVAIQLLAEGCVDRTERRFPALVLARYVMQCVAFYPVSDRGLNAMVLEGDQEDGVAVLLARLRRV